MDLGIFEKEYRNHFVVSEQTFLAFQQCSGDFNPLHTKESFAKEKGFPSCVMYGNILNAFLSFFVGMMLPVSDVIIHSQDIVFRNPVFLNDALEFQAEVSNLSEAVQAVEFKYAFRKEDGLLVAKGHIQIGILESPEKR